MARSRTDNYISLASLQVSVAWASLCFVDSLKSELDKELQEWEVESSIDGQNFAGSRPTCGRLGV
jgi:hypothetical protein